MLRVTKLERGKAGILLGMTLDCHRNTLCGEFHVEIQTRDYGKPKERSGAGCPAKSVPGPDTLYKIEGRMHGY